MAEKNLDNKQAAEKPSEAKPLKAVENPPAPEAPAETVAPAPAAGVQEPKKKSKWWLWTCLGCSIIFMIFIIIAGLIGWKIYKDSAKNPLDTLQSDEEIDYREYQEVQTEFPDGQKYQVLESNTYKVTEKVVLTNNGQGDASKIDLRMAMIKDIEPYQDVISENIQAAAGYDVIGDDDNNKYAHFDLPGLKVGEKFAITAEYQVKVNALDYNLTKCDGELVDGFLSAEKYIESDNPTIKTKAQNLAKGDKNKCISAKDIYDYVADSVTYEGYVPQDQGALNAFNKLSGDCTDFTDLFLGLSRAAGVPARFLEGLGYAEDAKVPADVKHDWAEVYLPGAGWTQVDPTWGRYENTRNLHFAKTDGEHIIITRGRNLEVLNNAHYFAYNYWWNGEEAAVEFTEDWRVELVD